MATTKTQAARLSQRMQKEIKVLLSDPPHSATFTSLSTASIDAEIKGPEGTAYASGVFKIKIMIPNRYPFQPPAVTFVTPVYHPNIDTGGRICLDILNLPPKGAWQPSLNISAVLTSIGLLLAEPNPDDGLMCEASREYKYNRQVFDHKAKTMTEKYAKPGSGGSSSTSDGIQRAVHTGTQMDENLINEDTTCNSGHLKPSGSPKLSQGLSGSGTEMASKKIVKEAMQMADAAGSGKPIKVVGDGAWNLSQNSPSVSKRKLSLSCSDQFQNRDHSRSPSIPLPVSPLVIHSDEPDRKKASQSKLLEEANGRMSSPVTKNQEPKYPCRDDTSDHCNKKMVKAQKLSPLSDRNVIEIANCQSDTNLIQDKGAVLTNLKPGRFSTNRKLSLGLSGSSRKNAGDDKENAVPVQRPKLPPSKSLESLPIASRMLKASWNLDSGVGSGTSNSKLDKYAVDKRLQRELTGALHCSDDDRQLLSSEFAQDAIYTDEPTEYEAIIVSDSEDSDEEQSDPRKFIPSLVKKRLMGK
ncbi:hypothetical protein Drorol1_Dr00015821 [Drosera rotundifolia]